MLRRAMLLPMIAGPLIAITQNMVPNAGFENIAPDPNFYAQICDASGWSSPNTYCSMVVGCGTPDDYNTLGSGGANPPNTWWATVSPHTGNGMVGFAPWYVASPNFREYIRVALTAPMVMGTTYQVGFWLTNGVSTLHPYGISRLGVAFSTSPLTQLCGANIAYTPQLQIPQVVYSTTWQHFTFTYTAEGPYQYLCIGNFVPYASTVSQLLGASGNSGAYYYIDDLSVQAGTSLPIELLAFDAKGQDDGVVRCEWTTATEENNARFEVERSFDGETFVSIGTVDGAGTSTEEHQYGFIDGWPHDGLNYYRLRQVDFNSASTLSDVRMVDLPRSGPALVAWPNPGDGDVGVVLSSDVENSIGIELDDASGRTIATRSAAPGAIVLFTSLPRGCYVLRAVGDPLIRPLRLLVR